MARRPTRRGWLIALGCVLLLVAGVLVWISLPTSCGPVGGGSSADLRGVAGSESAAILNDPDVTQCLGEANLRITQVEGTGSFDIPQLDLEGDDFALFSSSPAADRLTSVRPDHPPAESPFSSPMVVATYRPVLDALRRVGVVRAGVDGSPVFDIAAYAELVETDTRWGNLLGNPVPAPTSAVLLRTTDPSDSNSAAMFLSIASYAFAGNRIITQSDVAAVLPKVCPLVKNQGYQERSSQYLFDRYLTAGIANTPMALVYEHQFRAAARQNKLQPDQVMIYPSPTVVSRYTLVALTEAGRRLSRELTQDPGIVSRAEEFGFRPAGVVAGERPEPLPESVDPPSYEVLGALLDRVGRECR